jgi:hypothetical protein
MSVLRPNRTSEGATLIDGWDVVLTSRCRWRVARANGGASAGEIPATL